MLEEVMRKIEVTAKKKDQGYTMIIVMCLMFLFMALALSMLFSSALVFARAEQAGMQKQSRVSALSFAEWMDKELAKGSSSGMLCKMIENRIYIDRNWPAYTGDFGHEESVAVLKFTPDTEAVPELEKLGDLEISMYWETEDGRVDPAIEDEDVELVVTVKAVVRDKRFSVTTRYEKTPGSPSWDGSWSVGGRE